MKTVSKTSQRKTRISFDAANPAMAVFKTRLWQPHMVYVLRADKPIRYMMQVTLASYTSVKLGEELGVPLGLLHRKQCELLESSEAFGVLMFIL